MSGDLGNLLTGEMGEAEARFAHEDFAGLCGRRVAQRVRRRRTVRAVGAGGGTALTAGALAVGATNVPWGTWGVAGVAPGATDCVTPSAGEFTYFARSPSASAGYSEGTVILATLDADGNIVYTDADGTVLEGLPDGEGRLVFGPGPGQTLTVDEATVSSATGLAVGETRVVVGTVGLLEDASGEVTVSASPQPLDDCYTPSPTPSVPVSASASASPSPDPTLAAKPEEIEGSPFECGFAIDSPVRETAGGGVTGYEWVDPDTFNASLLAKWPTPTDLPPVPGSLPLPMAHIDLDPGDDSNPAGVFGVGAPEDQVGDPSMSEPTMFVGASFVQVRDGVVVGTMKVDLESARTYYSFDYDGDHNVIDLVLVDAANAFLACPGEALDGLGLSTYVVAGSFTGYPASTVGTAIEYSWVAIESE